MTKYKIRVEDLFNQGASTYYTNHYYLEDCDSYTLALDSAKAFLDRDFEDIVRDCKTESDFNNYWSFHGEALYISPEDHPAPFNSRDYISNKLKQHFNN